MKIVKLPAKNGLGNTDGTELAPDKIVETLQKEIYLNEAGRKPQFKIESIPVDKSNIEQTNQNVMDYFSQNDDVPIIIGGDHSITYACFKAFSKKFPGAGIIILDAHPDLMNDFTPPTHEDFLRVLVTERILKPQNIVLVGTRNWHQNEQDFLQKYKLKNFTMAEIAREGLHEVIDSVMSVARQWPACYVSIDIDVVDPAFAPATHFIEPGGLTSRELLYFLARLKNLKNLKAFDLVEINPKKDKNNLTVKLGAKIIAEIN